MVKKEEVTSLLKDLLKREYLQRDIYETYSYYLSGLESPAIQEHLKAHLQEEQAHIDILCRYLMGLGAEPLLSRQEIPKIKPLTLQQILKINFKLENEAVKKYSEAIHLLESDVEYTSIRVDLEDILKQEQEHSHDLVQWLDRWRDER